MLLIHLTCNFDGSRLFRYSLSVSPSAQMLFCFWGRVLPIGSDKSSLPWLSLQVSSVPWTIFCIALKQKMGGGRGGVWWSFVFVHIEEQIKLSGVNECLDIWLQRNKFQIKNLKGSSYSEFNLYWKYARIFIEYLAWLK